MMHIVDRRLDYMRIHLRVFVLFLNVYQLRLLQLLPLVLSFYWLLTGMVPGSGSQKTSANYLSGGENEGKCPCQ